MKNADRWRPSKFVFRDGRLRASRDTREVSIGSRLAADLVAAQYGRHLEDHARGRLADLGCGKVPLYGAYRTLVSEAFCVDWQNSLHGNEYLDLACDLSAPLPLPDRVFDTVILSDVLEHLPEPQLLWQEIARILRTGGKLLLNVPFLYGLHEVPHDYCRYSEFALRRFAAGAGLEVLLLERTGGAPQVLADIAAKTLLLYFPRAGAWAADALQQAAALFARTRVGGRISAATAAQFPAGYFLVARKPA